MLYRPLHQNYHEFNVDRDTSRCIGCQVCIRQCSYRVHDLDSATGRILQDETLCVGCHRCEALCPTEAITIRRNPSDFKDNNLWSPVHITNIYKQAATGGVLLTGMGNPDPYRIYWDHMLLDASQVTNPSIDVPPDLAFPPTVNQTVDVLAERPRRERGCRDPAQTDMG